ncbi:hypothetical protein OW763_00105 [Clostridium aestuarii]|uniref:Uncharacterized protein n=1 Tax=Clostridium aestuarii TaxID=338193 RepID=A0ABT4CUV9_9CLOT|nr:hypothetical protein [Clostridium aestuarii]MCY6482759.1 hypothetical protein [Clostridium aestuarii]
MQENLEINDGYRHSDHDITQYECIIAAKVYGRCKQQDCLRPDFIPGESEVESIPIKGSYCNEEEGIYKIGDQIVNIPKDQLIKYDASLPTGVSSVNVVDESFGIEEIKIIKEEPLSVYDNDGYWKITILYKFTYKLRFYDSGGNVINITPNPPGSAQKEYACAYSLYEKEIVLFGGIGQRGVYIGSNLFSNQGAYGPQNSPYVLVQAKASALGPNMGTITEDTTTYTIFGVTIGLFTIIKLYRLVNISVPAKGCGELPDCVQITPGDPCSYFNDLEFPYDEFDPPSSEPEC